MPNQLDQIFLDLIIKLFHKYRCFVNPVLQSCIEIMFCLPVSLFSLSYNVNYLSMHSVFSFTAYCLALLHHRYVLVKKMMPRWFKDLVFVCISHFMQTFIWLAFQTQTAGLFLVMKMQQMHDFYCFNLMRFWYSLHTFVGSLPWQTLGWVIAMVKPGACWCFSHLSQ